MTKKPICARIILGCFASIGFMFSLYGQPSGGPYGPIAQTYEIPKIKGKIYYVAVDGKPENSGENLNIPTTIESAFEKVNSGDAIILRGGVYRTGNLILNQGIIIQPYKNEQPILKGTYVATEWQNLGNGLWRTSWNRLFPSTPADWWRREREGKKTPLYRFHNDMVFVNGKFLQAVGWEGEVNESTYFIDYEKGHVYIGVDPTDKLVEITAFDVGILRTTKECHGKKSAGRGFVLRGVTVTQYAYRAIEVEGTEPEGVSDEKQHGKDVVGTQLEHCTISYCSRVAAYLRGDSLVVRHCKISDTSTEGLYIIASNDVLLEKNIFTRNNIENITGYFPAAVKIFNQCHRVTCTDNLVIDLPNSNGIWYDVGNVDGVFINNWVQDVGNIRYPIRTDQVWPSDNGFFFEISKGAVCAGNVFVNCDHGLMVLNSSNVQMYNNTFINSMACIARTGRTPAGDLFGWHSATGPEVEKREGHVFMNNLLVADENWDRPLLYIWQPAMLCKRLPNSQLSKFDHNVFVTRSERELTPLILWSPANNEKCQMAYNTLDAFRKSYPEFLKHSAYFPNYLGALFKGMELGRFELLQDFPGKDLGISCPQSIRKLFRISTTENVYVGAYPIFQEWQ